ncbi:DEAD/DEAH box helicase [Haloechinothrix halophila]|uniref:DEAD/DEAH box helicase n=1 Tax=Haloechinothrix halophila TaxID=1069073 RepID=UPI000424A762|nr:SNF2-related protein [Haloechinothrix halophila]
MRYEVPLDIDPAEIIEAVGPDTYARGLKYAREGKVERAVYRARAGAIVGTVNGNARKPYTTTARLAPEGGFAHGECSCPVGFNCKHVVALVLAAGDDGEGNGEQTSSSWEQPLQELCGTKQTAATHPPLGIELMASRGLRGREHNVSARLVRPGKRDGWVAGDLSWTRLDSLHLYGDYDDEQVRLLQELYALAQPPGGARYPGRYHGYSSADDKYIDLSTFGSRQLWPLLDQARSAGVRLVHGSRRGELDPVCDAEVCLDVTRSKSGGLDVTPLLRVDDGDAGFLDRVQPRPLRFIGRNGHGLVFTDRAAAKGDPSGWPLWLAKLAKPASEQLQQLVLDGRKLPIPAAGVDRFRDEFYPQLRHTATIMSSDDSFAPPEISEPELVLTADYREGHELELSWAWRYHIGDAPLTIRLDGPLADSGVRDLPAEQAIVERLDTGLERFSLARGGQSQARMLRDTRLSGVETMRFTTELLPLLSDTPGLEVTITGEQPDYREAGESLRIGLSTEESDGRDWFDLGVSITVEGREVPFSDVFKGIARGESHLLLPDGAFFSLEKPELQSLRRLIEEARSLQDVDSDILQISRFQADLWGELTELGVVESQASEWRRQVDGLLALGTLDPPKLPANLNAQLRPYQEDGYGWLTFLWRHQLGGVLADDMGLGKTLQTLALASHAKESSGGDIPPFLIVAPASVVSNWATEAQRFTPDLNVVPVGETLARRGESLVDVSAGADVVVTSYTLLRLDFEEYESVAWSGLVLDEAQFAKNHKSKVYQCARRLPAPFKLAITGTPMENNLMELWSLLSITAPGLFPNPTRFKEYYSRPIERGESPELLAQLRRRIKPLVKRRTKEQVVADLPRKQEQVLEVELHERHRTIYERHLHRERQKVLKLLDDVDRNRFTILRSLTLLRQLSLHPAMVDEQYADVPCGKLDALFEHLHEVIDGGHRALVFSQFTGFLDQVRKRMIDEGIAYTYLDGKTRNRADVIDQFKSGDAPVFLISLKAGGFGLNLTEADYCFLLDPWWNPATESQAVDRTHRIGQTRNVMVYRLISSNTIEEKVMALKERKAQLFASVMEDGGAFSSALDADDIRALFE